MLQPAGQPVWPVSTDSPNVLLHPLLFSGYWQTSRDQGPVTSPFPTCNFRKHILKNCCNKSEACYAFPTFLQSPWSPIAPAPLQTPMSPQQWAQSAWLALASWALMHLIAGLSSVEWGFLHTRQTIYLLSSKNVGLGLFFTFKKYCLLPFGASRFSRGHVIFLIQYSERMP